MSKMKRFIGKTLLKGGKMLGEVVCEGMGEGLLRELVGRSGEFEAPIAKNTGKHFSGGDMMVIGLPGGMKLEVYERGKYAVASMSFAGEEIFNGSVDMEGMGVSGGRALAIGRCISYLHDVARALEKEQSTL
jgi:hypothetical protein